MISRELIECEYRGASRGRLVADSYLLRIELAGFRNGEAASRLKRCATAKALQTRYRSAAEISFTGMRGDKPRRLLQSRIFAARANTSKQLTSKLADLEMDRLPRQLAA